MKTQVAAAISIAGVLVAGSAAALVNSQVFDSTPNESGASAAVLPPPSSIELTIPEATMPPSIPSTTAEPTTTVQPSTTAQPATGMLTAFEVGDAGVVTVDVIEGRLVFVGADASAGWTIVSQEDDNDEDRDESADEVEVVFQSSTVRVEFEAKLIGGEIVPHVESEAIGGSAPAGTAPSASTPVNSQPPVSYDDDHDDDDEYEDDDRYEDHDDDDRYEDHDDEDDDRDDD